MLQLVYSSVAETAPTQSTMMALCEEASRNNARDEITGVLISHNGRFLQAIEGPREATENTFIRIIGDARHHSVQLLSRRLVTARQFGDWSMAQVDDCDRQRLMIDRVRTLMVGAPPELRDRFENDFSGS